MMMAVNGTDSILTPSTISVSLCMMFLPESRIVSSAATKQTTKTGMPLEANTSRTMNGIKAFTGLMWSVLSKPSKIDLICSLENFET